MLRKYSRSLVLNLIFPQMLYSKVVVCFGILRGSNFHSDALLVRSKESPGKDRMAIGPPTIYTRYQG